MVAITLEVLNSNFESLMAADLRECAGKWVTVVDGKIVYTGDSAKEIYEKTKKKMPNKQILIAKAPDKEIIVV